MSGKRKERKSNSSSSSVSDHEFRSPDRKKVRETLSSVSSSSSLDHSSDEILDALEMAQDLGSKVDLILARLLDIDKKLEQINSSVSNLENKLDKMDNRVQHLEEAQSKTSTTVNELQAGLTELNTQVNEDKTANEKVKEDCEDKCKALEDKLLYAEVYSRRENLRFFGIEENSERED